MADFAGISDVTRALKELLEAYITHSSEPQLKNVPVELDSPRELRRANKQLAVSLWLYQVIRNPEMLNHPPQRPALDKVLHRPLPVNLYYLVTPLAPKTEDEQALLGRVLQVLNDQPMLLAADGTELRLTLEPHTLEELTRVWAALQESYQLSVSYCVQAVLIDSERPAMRVAPVAVRDSQDSQITSGVTAVP